jgi:hypothetical protein
MESVLVDVGMSVMVSCVQSVWHLLPCLENDEEMENDACHCDDHLGDWNEGDEMSRSAGCTHHDHDETSFLHVHPHAEGLVLLTHCDVHESLPHPCRMRDVKGLEILYEMWNVDEIFVNAPFSPPPHVFCHDGESNDQSKVVTQCDEGSPVDDKNHSMDQMHENGNHDPDKQQRVCDGPSDPHKMDDDHHLDRIVLHISPHVGESMEEVVVVEHDDAPLHAVNDAFHEAESEDSQCHACVELGVVEQVPSPSVPVPCTRCTHDKTFHTLADSPSWLEVGQW